MGESHHRCMDEGMGVSGHGYASLSCAFTSSHLNATHISQSLKPVFELTSRPYSHTHAQRSAHARNGEHGYPNPNPNPNPNTLTHTRARRSAHARNGEHGYPKTIEWIDGWMDE